MAIETKIVVAKTELGLFSVYLATNRFRLPLNEQSVRTNLIILALMNLALVTITMINIKTERFEKKLIDAEQKRIAKLEAMEELGDDAAVKM